MSIYDLPQIHVPKINGLKIKKRKSLNGRLFGILVLIILISSISGFLAGLVSGSFFYLEIKDYLAEIPGFQRIIEKETIIEKEYIPQTSQEQAIINVVNETAPAVVSIIVTKDLPVFEKYYISPFEEILDIPQYRQKGTEKREIGGGTGFIVSADGMVLTNKHVVLDEEADYTILTNDGKRFSARVLARDPFQDIAILKIDTEKSIDENGDLVEEKFSVVELGDSDSLQSGQTVIAIGNALGEFRNTVSVGVVSGLGRTITASGGDFVETIEDVIQTDAAINKGNSGGPLLNLKGEVMGINTATVLEAQSIGFAIPINKAKRDIRQVNTFGKIVYAYLGIYYAIINEDLQEEYDLSVSYGAWVGHGSSGEETPIAVIEGTAAEESGIERDDIVLEFDDKKITTDNSLVKLIQRYDPGDQIVLKVLRGEEEIIITVTLGEREE